MSPVRRTSRPRALAALLAPALAALAGCNTGFAPQYRVTDLRILAVQSQVVGTHTADADLGDTVRLTALVANPQGRAGLSVRWRACRPTDAQTLPPCLDPQWIRDPARFDGPEAVAAGILPLEAVPGATLAPDGTWIQVPLTDPQVQAAIQTAFAQLVQNATANPAFACTLYVDMPVVVIATAAGRQEVSVKRVRLTPLREVTDPALVGKYVLNLNPGVAGMMEDPSDAENCTGGTSLAISCDGVACTQGTCTADPQGGAPTCSPPPGGLDAVPHVLCGVVDASLSQTYFQCSVDGILERDERTNWQWYTTDGSFSDTDAVGNATNAHPRFTRPAGAFTIWLLLRDGRGGEAWMRRDFPALP